MSDICHAHFSMFYSPTRQTQQNVIYYINKDNNNLQVIRRILSGDMQAKQRKRYTYIYEVKERYNDMEKGSNNTILSAGIYFMDYCRRRHRRCRCIFYLEYFLVNKYATSAKKEPYTTHKRRNNTTGYIILEIWLWQVVFFSFFPFVPFTRIHNTCVQFTLYRWYSVPRRS